MVSQLQVTAPVAAQGLPRMGVLRPCCLYCLVFVQEADRLAGPLQATRTLAGRQPACGERFPFDAAASVGVA